MTTRARLRIPFSDEDHAQGPTPAPLTGVEYGDYECPACGMAYPIIKNLQKRLEGDLRFVFRNFPLATQHPHAMEAAMAAEAAGRRGKFWEMHDLLYENQASLDAESVFEYAADLNLDLGLFVRDMRSPEVEARISRDLNGGARSGVNGTPGIFIVTRAQARDNGFRYDGDWSFESLLTALTEEGLGKTG